MEKNGTHKCTINCGRKSDALCDSSYYGIRNVPDLFQETLKVKRFRLFSIEIQIAAIISYAIVVWIL